MVWLFEAGRTALVAFGAVLGFLALLSACFWLYETLIEPRPYKWVAVAAAGFLALVSVTDPAQPDAPISALLFAARWVGFLAGGAASWRVVQWWWPRASAEQRSALEEAGSEVRKGIINSKR